MSPFHRQNSVDAVNPARSEPDFVAGMQGERIYIQVAQEVRDEKTIDREYESLLKIQDNYPKYVLSTQDLAAGNYEGIKSMHIADWLLAE